MVSNYDFRNLDFEKSNSGDIEVFDRSNKKEPIAVLKKISSAAIDTLDIVIKGDVVKVSKSQFQSALQAIANKPNIDVSKCVSNVMATLTGQVDVVVIGELINKAAMPKLPPPPPPPPTASAANKSVDLMTNRPPPPPLTTTAIAVSSTGSVVQQKDEANAKTATTPFTPPLPEIQFKHMFPAPAEQLWTWCVGKYPMKPEQFLFVINAKADDYQAIIKNDPSKVNPNYEILLHKLYDKVAEMFLKAGNRYGYLDARSRSAEMLTFNQAHPLYNFDQAVLQRTDPKMSAVGAHFSHFDTDTVKGHHLRIDQRKFDNDTHLTNVLQFQINHVARGKLKAFINAIKEIPPEILKEKLPALLKNCDITITEVPYVFKGKNPNNPSSNYTAEHGFTPKITGTPPTSATIIRIEFKGLGVVEIGANEGVVIFKALANNVVASQTAAQPPGVAAAALQQMFSILGLGPVLAPSRAEDLERSKIGKLFHVFYPRDSHEMQATEEFYELPIKDLMAKIIAKQPKMKDVFEKYLKEMSEIEVNPGQFVWSINLSEEMRKKGGVGLVMGIGAIGINKFAPISEVANQLISMFNLGALSTVDRLQTGAFKAGLSSVDDLVQGGAEQVFTSLVTQNLLKRNISNFQFHGTVQLVIDLDAVNQGCYGYPVAIYGKKNITDADVKGFISENDDIPAEATKFLENMNNTSPIDLVTNIDGYAANEGGPINNEVLLKNRIPPQLFRGVVLRSENEKAELLKILAAKSVKVEKIKGIDTIIGPNGIKIGIHVANPKTAAFNAAMWNKL